jgi:hypothetical protein
VWTVITGKEFSFLTSVSLVPYELIRHAHCRSITRSIKVRLHDRSCRILTLLFISDIPNNYFCCPLLKKFQLNFTACRRKTHRPCQKISYCHCVTFFSMVAFLRYFVYNKPESNLCSAITILNTTEKTVLSHIHKNTKALQPDVFLMWSSRCVLVL